MRCKLNKKEKLGVRCWLEHEIPYECPFLAEMPPFGFLCSVETGNPYWVCKSWFPRIITQHVCPCNCYALSTVIHKAKEMIK